MENFKIEFWSQFGCNEGLHQNALLNLIEVKIKSMQGNTLIKTSRMDFC